MSEHIQTTTTFEVEIDLTGSYAPGYLPTRDDPGHDGEVEDCDVAGVFALRLKRDRQFRHFYERIDILTGLDKAARDQIAANILAFLGDEAPQLIAAEARAA